MLKNPTTAELERDAAKFRTTDQLHSSDQSLHAQEVDRLRQQPGQKPQMATGQRQDQQKKK